jgi:glycosyltransferase EpsF
MNIRTLHFVSTLDKGSGVTNVVLNFLRGLKNNEVKIDFLYFKNNHKNESSYIDEIYSFNSKTFRLKLDSFFDLFSKKLSHQIKDLANSYDIVHFHEIYIGAIIYFIFKKFNPSLKFVFHSHNSRYSDNLFSGIRNFLVSFFIIKHLNVRKISCSLLAGRFSFGRNFDKNNVVLNSIKNDAFFYDKDQRNILRDKFNLKRKFVVLQVGRFELQKNHFFTLELMKLFSKTDFDVHFFFIGQGSRKLEFENYVFDSNLSLYSTIIDSTSNINGFLSMADLLILPSIYEGLPVISIEAQFNSLKIYSSDLVTRESNISDVLFLPLKKELWYEKIIDLYENRSRSVLNIALAKKFDLSETCKKIVSLYKSL